MSGLVNYIWSFGQVQQNTQDVNENIIKEEEFTIAIAESVSAGTVQTIFCAEPGASKFFKGGITTYSIQSKKDILNIDIDYAEKQNFANPFTTLEMAKAVVDLYKARIGISTTGYSLPMYRKAIPEQGLCELNITEPYAYICLYDKKIDAHVIERIELPLDKLLPDHLQRAQNLATIAIKCKKLYVRYKNGSINKSANKSANKNANKKEELP